MLTIYGKKYEMDTCDLIIVMTLTKYSTSIEFSYVHVLMKYETDILKFLRSVVITSSLQVTSFHVIGNYRIHPFNCTGSFSRTPALFSIMFSSASLGAHGKWPV